MPITPILYILTGVLIGFIYRSTMKYLYPQTIRGQSHNIDNSGRIWRTIAGVALCIYAYLVPGHDLIYIGAGFCFFQAAFSWCGLYVAMGKSTCPIQ